MRRQDAIVKTIFIIHFIQVITKKLGHIPRNKMFLDIHDVNAKNVVGEFAHEGFKR